MNPIRALDTFNNIGQLESASIVTRGLIKERQTVQVRILVKKILFRGNILKNILYDREM